MSFINIEIDEIISTKVEERWSKGKYGEERGENREREQRWRFGDF